MPTEYDGGVLLLESARQLHVDDDGGGGGGDDGAEDDDGDDCNGDDDVPCFHPSHHIKNNI